VGTYNPVSPRVEDQCRIKADRVLAWLEKGAQLSETARSLCLRAGVELPKTAKRTKRERKRTETRARNKNERFMRFAKAKKERRLARLAAKKAAAASEGKEAE